MLRISTLKSASDYYTKSLTKGDYYSEQSEISGEWQGLGASRLGIFGEIKKEQFDLLCAGNHPLTGDQLSSRIVADRREAYDFTFSVPKSVSVLSAVSSPEVASLLQDRIKESMKYTMNEVQKNIQTRIRESGKNDNRVTGNIVYGYFLHKNSRPVDGYSDPQLHIHAVVMNLTFDGVDKKWKAIQMRDKVENREYYNSIFNSNLANRLQAIGLEIRKTHGDFDLATITNQTIKTFSRRTDEIEKEAIAQNIHSSDAKGKLGARTRQSKSEKHSQSELQGIYQNLLSPDQKIVTQSLSNQLQSKIDNNHIDYKVLDQNLVSNQVESQNQNQLIIQTSTQDQTKKWLDYSLEHHFERHSTSSEQRLIGEVLKNGIGQTNLEMVTKQLEQYKKQGVLIDEITSNKVDIERIEARNNLSPSITTQVALAEEQNIIKLINSRVNTYNPVNLQYSQIILQDTFLSPNQKKVVSELMLSLDGIDLLEGKAGTGKTTTLKAVEIGLNQAGYSVTVLAPTTKAVEVLQSEGFVDSMTVSKYLLSPEDSELRTKTKNYLIVDEASLVSVRQMNKLLTIANDSKYRVILVGDTKQHKSVERGNTLKTIQEHSYIETYSLNQIQRQTQNEAKQAVEDLSKGKVLEGIAKFEKLGFVKEISDDKTRLEMVASLYLKHLPQVYTSKIQKQDIQVELTNQPRKSFLDRIKNNDIFGNQKQYETQTQISFEKIEYQKLTPQSLTLVITPTHKDGDDIHNTIRCKLKENNLIGQDDHTLQTIRSLTWTTAQKTEISNYQTSQILQFNSNILGFKKGEKWQVVNNQSETTQIQNTKQNTQGLELSSITDNQKDFINTSNNVNIKQIQSKTTGELKEIPTSKASYFEVYKQMELTISKKDLIQIQKQTIVADNQGVSHQLTNGAIYQIKSISPKSGDLTLSNNWIIPHNFGNIKSAYYSTSQSSQGQTVQHSIFYTSAASLPLLNQEMVYVANSRFKQSNMILTPNLEEFKQQAAKGELKSVAMSVVEPRFEQSTKITKPEISTAIQKPDLENSNTLSQEAPKKKMKR